MTPYDTGETKDIPEEQASSVSAATGRPSRSEAEAAVELLLRWIGDDPAREGLVADVDQRGRQVHLGEAAAALEGFVADVRHRLRERHR